MTKVYKIFAYGSLINQASLKKTVPEAREVIPVKAYGLQRVFNLASNYRFDDEHNCPICVLNLTESSPEAVLNGICFEMDEISLDNLLERERGYDFCQTSVQQYHDESCSFEAYYFRAHLFNHYQYLPNSRVQKHYLNLCLQGSQEFGADFISDFKSSTSFWGIECEKTLDAIWSGCY